ncbi:hypothetical protein D910_00903 [Dendroctonus ponderosae]|uniref:RNA-directed DNA polymerase n=1 Tax=Dendroctonus ponderosae TaxID=77166 RepID=U4UU46_DENPD|nr:hypothetical protein D910_00903 [Dendroctonus ponderosae]
MKVFQETFKNNAYKLAISNTLLEDITDSDEQKQIIERYHVMKTSHRGMTENIKNIKQTYYWPTLERDVINYVNTCETCQKSKYERHPYKLVYKPTPTGTKPFEDIYIDIYSLTGQKFLTIIDNFSNKVLLTSWNTTKITSDNASTFKSTLIQDVCKTYQIELHFTTPYNPNSNSPVQRFNSTLKEALISLRSNYPSKNVQELIDIAMINYNNSIHSSYDYTTSQIIRQSKLPIKF